MYHLLKNAERFGLPRVETKAVDYRDIAKRIESVIGVIQKHDSEERFCKLGVKVEFGEPVFADEHSVQLNGRRFSANSWVIATGSSPDVPGITGIDKTQFITNRELFSLERLPSTMLVIGAGPVAIEMAQAFCRLGTKVSVIQRSGQILSKEDEDMACMVMDVMAVEGVIFHLDSAIQKVIDHGSEREVVIKNKEGRTISLRAEKILVALGRRPNIAGLGLEGISVEFDKKGLKLDRRLRTSHKHIYGAGDITGEHQFTHAAGYEGGIVLSNAILRLPRKTDYTNLPWCTFTDPELASIGMNEKRAKEAGIQYSVWTEEFRANDRGLAEAEDNGMVKLLLDKREQPLGLQIFGPHGGELISEWVAVMNGGVKLSSLASAVHPYPTLAEINKRVVGNFYSKKIFSDKVKKALKFFFNLRGRAC